MAQRTEALCSGRIIGIESIFTVIEGKQINIPEKLKELRKKSQNNELYCPCGCGANLILVAGDKNLREQHFRIKDGENNKNCTFVTEGKTSVDSKIVLKCWLDENIHSDDLESRVPISSVGDSKRKYEFTFISRSKGIALDYCYNRENLSDDKQKILDENSNGIKIIHVVDYSNEGTEGQYPEGLMKVQLRQKYCLLLIAENSDYDIAKMKTVFYDKDIDGLWQERIIAEGLLKKYRIDSNRNILFEGELLEVLLDEAIRRFEEENKAERQRREEERLKRIALEKQRLENAEKRRDEVRKRLEEKTEIIRKQEEKEAKWRIEFEEKNRIETIKRQAELEEARRLKNEKELEERKRRDADIKKDMESQLNQQETEVWDPEGNRWIKCEYCGKIAKAGDFTTYGGEGRINLGTCNDCDKNNPAVKAAINARRLERKHNDTKIKYDPAICPECGGTLTEKKGKYGSFMGCSGYPKCKFTRRIKSN